ncbi:MAG TPA: transglutaminase-like domain-containing protein, partial [Anaerolineales bacterium]|nr:transglutaminase-like domain-containing protein [Anaerolineales bacterium]
MIARLLRKLLSAEVLGVILVILSLQMLAYGISSSLRGTDTIYSFEICLIAAGLGWILSRSKLGVFYSAVIIAALGLAGIWIVSARLSLPLIDLIASITGLLPQIVPAIQEKIPLDTSVVLDAWTVVAQASKALVARWQTWLLGIDKNVTVNDALIRHMIWSLLIWLLAAWTGWFAARRKAIHALMPSAILLAVVLSYSEFRIYSLWVLVIIMLLLMGLWNYKDHTAQWQRRRVDYSDSILYDNTQAVVFLAILVGSAAFSIPSFSWRDVRDFLRERNSNEAAEMLGIRQQSVPKANTVFQKPSLPREHLLTEGFALSQELVMTVRTGELPPVANPGLTTDAPRHYWRSTIYDEYQGAGWVTSAASPQNYEANTPLVPGLLDGYRLLHLDVQLQQPEGKLFWSGILFSADVPFRADWRLRPRTSLFVDQTALLQADLFAAASSADDYRVDAYVPLATVEELRSAPAGYPEEIRARYLRLPRELPERVHDLAREITRGIENPYDKAKAIESYLRTNYPYDLEVPAPPQDQDVADYFLFDLKRGYCDYYATAMVVLARASGLPARFVSGYSSGSYDAPNAQYIVRELNAHSWAEIYFPEIGWVEFEPTASQPEIERIESEAEIPATDRSVTLTEKFIFQLTNTGILYWITLFVIALFLVLLYFMVLERLWILSFDPARAIAFLYRRYYRMGRSLAGERTRAETASEFTYKLIHTMDELRSNRSNPAKPFNRFPVEACQLTDVYLLS